MVKRVLIARRGFFFSKHIPRTIRSLISSFSASCGTNFDVSRFRVCLHTVQRISSSFLSHNFLSSTTTAYSPFLRSLFLLPSVLLFLSIFYTLTRFIWHSLLHFLSLSPSFFPKKKNHTSFLYLSRFIFASYLARFSPSTRFSILPHICRVFFRVFYRLTLRVAPLHQACFPHRKSQVF